VVALEEPVVGIMEWKFQGDVAEGVLFGGVGGDGDVAGKEGGDLSVLGEEGQWRGFPVVVEGAGVGAALAMVWAKGDALGSVADGSGEGQGVTGGGDFAAAWESCTAGWCGEVDEIDGVGGEGVLREYVLEEGQGEVVDLCGEGGVPVKAVGGVAWVVHDVGGKLEWEAGE